MSNNNALFLPTDISRKPRKTKHVTATTSMMTKKMSARLSVLC